MIKGTQCLRGMARIKRLFARYSIFQKRMARPRMGQGLFIQLIAMGLVGAFFATSAHAHTRTFHFAIVDQSLSQALRTYGQVCGQEIIFTEDVTAGVGATSLEGDFTAQDALGRLLDDSGLVAVRSPSGAVMIRRRAADAEELLGVGHIRGPTITVGDDCKIGGADRPGGKVVGAFQLVLSVGTAIPLEGQLSSRQSKNQMRRSEEGLQLGQVLQQLNRRFWRHWIF